MIQFSNDGKAMLMMICDELRGSFVRKVRDAVRDYWSGLCLTCMDMSDTPHSDYWNHNDYNGWSNGCKIGHHRNTWYHSFMGCKDMMDEHQARERASRGMPHHRSRA